MSVITFERKSTFVHQCIQTGKEISFIINQFLICTVALHLLSSSQCSLAGGTGGGDLVHKSLAVAKNPIIHGVLGFQPYYTRMFNPILHEGLTLL